MLGVDDIRELFSVDLLLKDPHLDCPVKVVKVLNVGTNDLCNGRAPGK